MKKNIRNFIRVLVSCLTAALIFCILGIAVINANAKTDSGKVVFFSEDGSILRFFGETVYISQDTADMLYSLPGRSARLCLSFVPQTIERSVCAAFSHLVQSGKSFFGYVGDGIFTFLSSGTRI